MMWSNHGLSYKCYDPTTVFHKKFMIQPQSFMQESQRRSSIRHSIVRRLTWVTQHKVNSYLNNIIPNPSYLMPNRDRSLVKYSNLLKSDQKSNWSKVNGQSQHLGNKRTAPLLRRPVPTTGQNSWDLAQNQAHIRKPQKCVALGKGVSRPDLIQRVKWLNSLS